MKNIYIPKSRDQKHVLLFRKSSVWECYKPRHVTKRDIFLFINSTVLDFEVTVINMVSFFAPYFFQLGSKRESIRGTNIGNSFCDIPSFLRTKTLKSQSLKTV